MRSSIGKSNFIIKYFHGVEEILQSKQIFIVVEDTSRESFS